MENNPNLYKYLPINQSDRDWGIWVTGSGVANIKKNEAYPPTGHPSAYQMTWESGRRLQEYQILYIIKGKGKFESDHISQTEIREGDILILFPGVWHRYQPNPLTGWEEYWVGFNGELIDRLLLKKFITPINTILHVGHKDEILAKYININLYLREEMIGYNQLAAAEVFSLISKILTVVKHNSSGGTHIEEKIVKAKMIMMEACESNLDIKDVATSVGMSYENFRRIFKEVTGFAPYQYHLDHKINRAKELLLMTSMSIKMITDRLNFKNQYYFSRVFKLKTGLSPSEWKNNRNNRFQKKGLG